MVAISTWNVNSVRARADRFRAWLAANGPDIVAVTETRSPSPADTVDVAADVGYHSVVCCGTGRAGGRNGVAISTRGTLKEHADGLPGPFRQLLAARADLEGWTGPLEDEWAADARYCESVIDVANRPGVDSRPADLWRVVCVYVPNGRELDDPHYLFKLAWLDALADHLQAFASDRVPTVVCGDFNVAPSDLDCWNPRGWVGRTHVSEPERNRVRQLEDDGWVDAWRHLHPQPGRVNVHGADVDGFTWWNYRGAGFSRDQGLRIDLLFTNPAATGRLLDVTVDRDERSGTKPSDHAPLTGTFTPR